MAARARVLSWSALTIRVVRAGVGVADALAPQAHLWHNWELVSVLAPFGMSWLLLMGPLTAA